MLTIKLGSLVLPLHQFMLIVSVLVAYGVSYLIGRRLKTANLGNLLTDMLIAALLAARLAFVVAWFELYRSAPWSMIDIRDGGFTPWAGILAALLIAIWRGWRNAVIRKPLIVVLAAGALAWGAMFGTRHFLQGEPAMLPIAPLTTLAGEQTELARLAGGKPMVVNLWASWCPPCHREMPLLAAEQKRQSDVTYVFVNQGEEQAIVQRYLSDSRFDLSNVLLDRDTGLGKAVGSMALPTTLFYDRAGRLVDTHLGELSAASLANKLKQIR
ncbi:MAG: TlpA disulfide reductase family protein [Collimonas sp.]